MQKASLRIIPAVVLAMGAAVLPPTAAAQTPSAKTPGTGGRPVTFAKDVAPIFQEKCEVCHRPDNIGPMSLITYDEVRPWVRSIKTRVANREMPPWHLDKGVGIRKFINDRSLSDAQIDTIVRWVDAGAPRGDMKDMPPAKQWPSGDRFFLEDVLGPPDLVIRAKPYTMPAQAADMYFEAEANLPLTEPRWVRASETKPSLKGRRIAHHANTWLLRPQTQEAIAAERAARAGQAGANTVIDERLSRAAAEREGFSEWAQGKDGEIFPDNVGKLVMPGTKVYFRMHYHAVGEDVTDTMEMGWWFHPKGKTPKYSADYVTLTGAGGRIEIPPNTVTEHQGATVLKVPTILHNFQPHMHYRGKAQTLEAVYPDGRREIINQVSNFNNAWHINYIYDPDHAPVFPKGTVLIVTTVHDNTAANKNNPDPRQWVTWGERTVDEMAHLNQQLIYITEEDYRRIVEGRKKKSPTLAAAAFASSSVRAQQTPAKPREVRVTEAQLEKWMEELSNWGRWGKDDVLGAANTITPEKRRQAAALVRTGETVSLSHDLKLGGEKTEFVLPFNLQMRIVPERQVVRDRQDIDPHGNGGGSHIDALCHMAWARRFVCPAGLVRPSTPLRFSRALQMYGAAHHDGHNATKEFWP